jgi:hypothetical protein
MLFDEKAVMAVLTKVAQGPAHSTDASARSGNAAKRLK